MNSQLPAQLIDDILSGNCVAFVGAGFSAGAVPPWRDLLGLVAREANPTVAARVGRLLVPTATGHELEVVAQMLRDDLGDAAFAKSVAGHVANPGDDATTSRRRQLLRGIPFRSILTTNFDGVLEGEVPGRDAYLSTLRSPASGWWDRRFWEPPVAGAPIIKLHGDAARVEAANVVFTRRDYRSRLYSDPAYMTFLRSMFATTTLLYLGVSFSDSYLNELRSEILALLDYRGGDRPVAYAVLPDVDEFERHHLRRHEGIEVVPYSTGSGSHRGFDDVLQALFQATNARHVLGSRLLGKRIMWVDPGEWDADEGMAFLRETAALVDESGTEIVPVRSPAKAFDALASGSFDLVVTHWGYGQAPDGTANGEFLLRHIRSHDIRVPVMVFAGGAYADVNRRAALSLGALLYTASWDDLFRGIADLFT